MSVNPIRTSTNPPRAYCQPRNANFYANVTLIAASVITTGAGLIMMNQENSDTRSLGGKVASLGGFMMFLSVDLVRYLFSRVR